MHKLLSASLPPLCTFGKTASKAYAVAPNNWNPTTPTRETLLLSLPQTNSQKQQWHLLPDCQRGNPRTKDLFSPSQRHPSLWECFGGGRHGWRSRGCDGLHPYPTHSQWSSDKHGSSMSAAPAFCPLPSHRWLLGVHKVSSPPHSHWDFTTLLPPVSHA